MSPLTGLAQRLRLPKKIGDAAGRPFLQKFLLFERGHFCTFKPAETF
jgi:hypothetical protein